MPSEIPSFAQAWARQWKQAGPLLEQIRDEELRQQGGKGVRGVAGRTVFEKYPEQNGMVVMQRWFMRQSILRHTDRG